MTGRVCGMYVTCDLDVEVARYRYVCSNGFLTSRAPSAAMLELRKHVDKQEVPSVAAGGSGSKQ